LEFLHRSFGALEGTPLGFFDMTRQEIIFRDYVPFDAVLKQ
jgi:hypothetical protein